MKLIADCAGAWKHYSTQALAIAGTIQGGLTIAPESFIEKVPSWMVSYTAGATFVILMFGLIGKFIDQGGSKVVTPEQKTE